MDIYALIGEVWAHKTNLTSPVFIEVPVPNLRTMSGHVFMCIDVVSFYDLILSIHEITYEYNKMKNKTYHTVGTFPKSNIKS
jgi:hypothetical protein